MKKILFVCLGNICRSPMAEFVFRDLVERRGLTGRYAAASAGTSGEELGNPVHPGTQRRLAREGISCRGKNAARLTREDYSRYDLLLGMERRNAAQMLRLFGGDPQGKVACLLDFSPRPRDIPDPWYTGDFDGTYRDILEGCACLLDFLEAQN